MRITKTSGFLFLTIATILCGAAFAGMTPPPDIGYGESLLYGAAFAGAVRPFPVDPRLTAIAIAYRNPDIALIADDVLPRTPTDAEFKYLLFDKGQGFTVPDAKVGRKSMPNEVEFSATEVQDKVVDYGLDDIVPNEDIEDDNQKTDPLGTSTAYLTNLVNLAREQRVANLVFNNASFATGNKTTLSGTSQWSDQVNSNPVNAIGDALDVPVMRPNIAVFGQQTWTNLRRHPKIVQAVFGTDQGAGMVSRQHFADLFELQAVYVGQGFINSAKKGQAVTLGRVWGKHAAFLYRDRAAGPQQGATFGFTAQAGDKIAGLYDRRGNLI
ncbi:hypothetical protein [Nitrosomonas sp. Nm166]|uniref:hypothetical protein n=1 Tax=Nitrosomonas sp. Nm166 TaxID=1881054 RepID=UPI0008EDE341|nr:hypothetical protein [Nitrosomonas sp. Nm166]SFF13446.1 hypothetical protein SAMN05428977_10548 [Nitrosomonas sp. Nm166]